MDVGEYSRCPVTAGYHRRGIAVLSLLLLDVSGVFGSPRSPQITGPIVAAYCTPLYPGIEFCSCSLIRLRNLD